MSRQGWLVAAVGLALAALVALGWSVRDRFLPVEVGSVAPDFRARDLAGRPVALADLRGQVVLLNLWATWCPPCREEMPSMQRLFDQLGPEGLRIVAVSVDAPVGALDAGGNPGGDVAAFVRRLRLGFDVWRDPDGRIARVYRTTGVPESFVIDRRGVVRRKVLGGTQWDTEANRTLFRRLLQED